MVEAVYTTASAPPFAERFATFSQDSIAKEQQQLGSSRTASPRAAAAIAAAIAPAAEPLVELPPSLPPSPPPSPPALLRLMKGAGGTSLAIGVFVFLESNKPWLLREAWKGGVLVAPLSALLMALALATGAGWAQWVALVSAAVGVVAALAGWWVCNNKKDDLVMMHALARFEEQLRELDQAEERLHAALETMLAADTDMHTLTAAITAATGEAKAQLAAIREHNERAARGTRRRVLDSVLVDLADDDGSLTMGPVQRRKLLRLIAHMAGRGADELPAFYAALGLKYAAQAAAHDDALPSGGIISEPSWRRGYGDANFVVHEAALPGDDPREIPTKEILDQLEELGAFEIIMGLRAPGEGGGGGIGGRGGRGGRGGGPEQEEEHARPEGAWEASGRRDVKRGGAKGSSHLPSEVLPLAVAEEEEGAENSTHR